MAITQSDRNVAIMAHVTLETKEAFRIEAERRKTTISALLSEVLEKWLVEASSEELEFKRSNKRGPVDPLRDIPLPLEEK